MRRRAALPLLLLGLLPSLGRALPPFWGVVQSTYAVKANSALGKAACLTCHAKPGGGPRNVFGKQVESALAANKAQMLTAAILKSVEPLDADGDGVTNGDELRAGTLPADASSKPTANARGRSSADGTNPDPGSPLLPRHTFHPAVVHFPVALFIFAAFLAFWRGGRFADAARVCAAGGAASLLVVLPTGLIAMLRLQIPIAGNMLIHLLLGLTTAALGAWAWRERSDRFRWIIVAAGLAAALTGYWGGLLVYGA